MRHLYTFLIATLLLATTHAQTGTGWNWASISGLASNAPGRQAVDIATDAAGNVLATGRFMGNMTIGGNSISTSGDGTVSGNYDEDAWIAKWDANGNIQWLKRYGIASVSSNQVGQVITTDADGNAYVGIGNGYPVVIKYDAAGNVAWTKTLTQFEIQGINIGPDGNPVVLASNAGAKDVFKLDKATGNILWTVSNAGIGSNSTTTYKDFIDQSGNIYYTAFISGAGSVSIAGQAYSTARATSYIVSLDNNGALRWVQPIDNVQIQLGYTIDKNGRSYIQISGGSGGTFQGVSTASSGGNRYLELDNGGALVRSAVASPYKGAFRVKDDGIYGFYLETGGFAATVVYGSNYFSIPANSTVGLGIVIKYDKGDDHVIWANGFEIDGASYNPGKFKCLDLGPGSRITVGGLFGTAAKFGASTLAPAIGGGFNQTDFFVAQFDGTNVQPSPTTTWTGTADNSWANSANWTNGAPIGAENAIIPSGAPRYPSGITNVNRTAKLTVQSGVSLSLPFDFNAPVGIVNNGVLEVTGSGTFTGFNNLPSSLFTGNGRLLFTANSPSTISYSLTTNALEINKTGGTITHYGGTVGGGLYLTNGILQASNPIILTDPNAPVTYSATAYMTGTLKRAISGSGTYVFPIANFYSYSGGPTSYTPVTIITNNMTGPQYISVAGPGFAQAAGSVPNINLGGGNTITTILNSKNYWSIVPDAPIAGGTYDVTLQTSLYSNGVTAASRYVVINRPADNATWNIEGTNGTSTQTGGTTNSNVVTNGTVTVTALGLKSSGTLAVGIASASIAAGTAVITSTWTGNSSTAWNNAGNWDNGIPNGLINAIIPTGRALYPQTYVAGDNARSIQVDAGATIKLPYNFSANGNVVNNGTIEVINGTSTTFFYGFGSNGNLSPLSGNGKLLFTTASPGIFQGTFNNSIEINRGTSSQTAQSVYVSGNINIISGNVYTSYLGNNTFINMTDPNATITTAAGYPLQGTLGRAVNMSGTYSFPIGEASTTRSGFFSLATNGVAGTTLYSAAFSTNYGFNKFVPVNGQPVYALGAGLWTLTPNNTPASGTVGLTLLGTGYSNGSADPSRYMLLQDSSGYWGRVPGAVITENAGVVTATANLSAPTVQTNYIIGVVGQTTQWTGAVSTAWINGSNWSNGVPTTSLKAQFVAGSPNYPTGITVSNTAGTMEIGAGVSLQLPQNFSVPQGITNNGVIEVLGTSTFGGINGGNTPLQGGGRLLFSASSPGSFSSGFSLLNNGLEVARAGNLSVTNLSIAGSLILTNGSINGNVTVSNPNATVTATTTSYVNGSLNRSVNASGSYLFPVGTAANQQVVNLALNNISGPQNITVSFSATSPGTVNTTAVGVPVTSALNGGYWTITPNTALTGGNYTVTLTEKGATNTVANADQYVVIKRANSASAWGFFGSNGTASQSSSVATAIAGNITGFSDFAIGIATSSVTPTLPLRFISFNAVRQGSRNVKLQWVTAEEQNTSRFEVEHSVDGAAWGLAGINAATQNTGLNTYDFLHTNLAYGQHFYRLKQVDVDGRFTYSTIVRVTIDHTKGIALYPNPVVQGRLTIANATGTSYTIVDNRGAMVSGGSINNAQASIDVSKLAGGMYWIRFSDGQSLSFFKH